MKKYDPNGVCPKCGDDHLKVTHVAHGKGKELDDYLQLTCQGCGYTWKEAPLDRKEED